MKTEFESAIQTINESIDGGVHISIDVQPDYNFHFDVVEYYNWMDENFSEVIVYINGEELGFQSEEEHINWLAEEGVDWEIIENIEFREKGYGFFRSCMDQGYTECLVDIIQYMWKHKITDSRDLDEEDIENIKLVGDCEEILEFLQDSGDSINLPDFMYEIDQDSLTNKRVSVSGGADGECLAEVRLVLDALQIKYEDKREWIY